MSQLNKIHDKILNIEELDLLLDSWKNKKVVFTNGCFDILHKGHIDYLAKASDLGDVLIVGLNSDASIKTLNKGKDRPLQDQSSRASVIASLQFVDKVILFNESTPESLINRIIPDVLVKGSDYKIEDIVGHQIVLENGGEVKTIDFIDGYSTTSIIQKAINSI